jgi:hypothetical protein
VSIHQLTIRWACLPPVIVIVALVSYVFLHAGKLSLVDLAGSERADKTGAGAERLK